MKKPAKLSKKGFTIIELMIATAVLSVMLVLVTVLFIKIGNLYYKGVSQARVQDNVRSITDEISKHLELSDTFTPVSSGPQSAYCIGNVRYTYVLNKQLGTDSPHVLWRDQLSNPSNCTTSLPNLNSSTPSIGGAELMTPHARLLTFNITTSSPYGLSVGEAYGDSALLVNTPSGPRCQGNSGDQFCATARLDTTVARRLP